MAISIYAAKALTGGAAGSLDAINGTNLLTNDGAYVITSSGFYFYYLNGSSGATESSPDVIAPDTNAGNKRWLLQTSGQFQLPDTDTSNHLLFKWNEDDSSDRILNFKVNSSDRTLDLSENLTVLNGSPTKLYFSSAATLSVSGNVDAYNHNAAHQSGGNDTIKLDDLAVPDDNTDLDASITIHGLLPKLPNNSSQYLNGVGTWATVSGTHATTHTTDSSDEIDGDMLDIDWNPSYSTPATSTEMDSVDNLSSHLKGVDTALNLKSTTTHAATHIKDGSDEIDGDKIDINWIPTYSTPATNATSADDLEHLTSVIKGLDTLAGVHASRHQSGGGDAIKLDDLSAPDDNTDLDVSTSAHGLMIKLPNDSDKYLNGVGTWATLNNFSLLAPDTDASHTMQLKWNEDDSSDRILNFKVNSGDRTLDLSENLTIGDPISNECNLSAVSNIDIDTGTETVDSFADTIGDGAMWFFVVKKATALRSGMLTAVWNAAGDAVEYTQQSTTDIGDTSDLVLSVDISADNVRLRAAAASDNWIVRSQRMVL